jgi:hypothetical protein
VVNNLAVAWCESSLRASARRERTIEDCLNFLLYAPLSPFRKEGGNTPCYPRWALNMVFPMSCYWVIRVDARALFDKGRLVARGALQKYLQVICWTRTHLIGSEGSVPPFDGIPLQTVPAGLGNVLGYLGSVDRALAM